ncbi:hypothetical protein [Fontivita pretiosa]|uniref:hypothetical protein n=1 Tax=Fontivita pretiosa TaxID=2989684 RepID=UPI003D174A92
MTQYPQYPQPSGQPYSPPYQPYPPAYAYGYDPAEPLLAPARRASVLMYVIAGMGMLCGLCVGAVGLLAPLERFAADSGLQSAAAELGLPAEQLLKVVYVVIAVLTMLWSLVLAVLGPLVRRGGLGAIVTAIVLVTLSLLVLAANLLTGLAQTRGHGAAALAAGLLVLIVPTALLGLLLAWLIQAARAAPAVRAARWQQMQYSSQYWQYQQQPPPPAPGGYQPPWPPGSPSGGSDAPPAQR